MKLEELDFHYPERLVATERAPQSRVMLVDLGAAEMAGPIEPVALSDLSQLLPYFKSGDLLVVNNTRVLKRRVFSESGLEILFLNSLESPSRWEVLCPSSRWKNGTEQILPSGVRLTLVSRGRPQVVESSEPLNERYFEECGELPLPPYIQKARGERHNRSGDGLQYQTAWAEKEGSLAAPTASLHFNDQHLNQLRIQGVQIAELTLHVGLGTFLPITAATLDEHVMHAETADIPAKTWESVQETRARGGKVWALGTTVTRTLEAAAAGLLDSAQGGGFCGRTDLFIRPGFEYKIVDRLMTNFHQPQSTLLALVAAFAGLENLKHCYQWAIEREFRLFSYGDLSVWMK